MTDLVLRYSHNVIEHLGVKLYQNKPIHVIAELVSNAWDAFASEVWIDIDRAENDNRFIVVGDNGVGMDTKTLIDFYFIIGKPKHQFQLTDETISKHRKLMGRKGIGKLAPFGIARQLDILTVYKSDDVRKVTWFRLNYNELLKQNGGSELTATYKPQVFLNHANLSEFEPTYDATAMIAGFLNKIGNGTGTVTVLTDLSLKNAIPLQSLKEAMGRRFTVTLRRDDFRVYINQHRLTEKEALPKFEFRLPSDNPFAGDYIHGKEIKFWVGFASEFLPPEQRGIGIYAHGKIVQDRPFTFGVTPDIDTQSMYGVIEADWLAEWANDVVSTDRTSIDWAAAETEALLKWGENQVRSWLAHYRAWRRGREETENASRIAEKIHKNELPKITRSERQVIAKLLSDITPRLGKDEQTKEQVTETVTQAWLHRPMRALIKDLWDEVKQGNNASGEVFLSILTQLEEHAVPESLSLAVTFAQRAYALSLLYDLVHKGKEPDLQQLIETFPWILHSDMMVLTANQTLKKVVEEAALAGLLPSNKIDVSARERPDFVYFSNSEETKFVVVEIKSPRNELTLEEREQLHYYMTFLEKTHPNAIIEGELIGNNPNNKIQAVRHNMKIRTWEDVLLSSRHEHLELLAAMLSEAQPDVEDARVKDLVKFGGDETWALLKKMAQHNDELANLFRKFKTRYE
jgi:hypothetical protein